MNFNWQATDDNLLVPNRTDIIGAYNKGILKMKKNHFYIYLSDLFAVLGISEHITKMEKFLCLMAEHYLG